MITAVDTSVIIDILEPDPVYGPMSREALRTCLREGTVVASSIVWAEVATAYGQISQDAVDAMNELSIGYVTIRQDSALTAAQHWFEYRQQGGRRERIVADFLIGAHAVVQCDRLLSRDRGFYRSYFTSLSLIHPAQPSP
ncbi:MAG: hypothetical protein ETSY1_17505 [Candidatus Entotheonella factor]|uniref:PIN domain-containing protein n=1 Tax=Entotheonella factor TaxID=1429438 RepID=W4LKY5_ENTF1|nr:MAG: hypothetical protein ETSY1_17505 [Candidatus Entotheonella factor]